MEQNAITPRSRRNREQILELLTEFENSKLSVGDFCNLHKVSKGAFQQWRTRHGKRRQNQSGFANLEITAPVSKNGLTLFAEVSGIKIYQPVAAAYLKELLG